MMESQNYQILDASAQLPPRFLPADQAQVLSDRSRILGEETKSVYPPLFGLSRSSILQWTAIWQPPPEWEDLTLREVPSPSSFHILELFIHSSEFIVAVNKF